MKSKLYLITILLFSIVIKTNAQGAYIISGKIFDTSHSQPLAGATIKIKGTNVATAAKEDGSFSIKVFQKFPITLIVSRRF